MDHQAFAQLLGNYGEFLGAIAVVATLFYLAVQVKHSKDATEANTRSLEQSRQFALNEAGFSHINAAQDVHNAIIQNTDVWLRGNAGESLDRVEAAIHKELILKMWGVAFFSAFALNTLLDVKDVAIHDFAIFLSQNPGARSIWEAHQRQEQDHRDRLLDEPGSAGADQVQIVLEDLKKLSNDSSNTAA